MKDVWVEQEQGESTKKLNKKKLIISIGLAIFVVLTIVIIGVYQSNKKAREWIDKNIFRKEVLQDKATVIELKENEQNTIYAFNKYIGILNKTEFTIYGNTGNKEATLEIQISNPIFDSANRFLAIAESKGKRLYLIEDKQIAWEAEVDGNISQIHVNKNGYVAVIITDTLHKTVIKMYSPDGNPLFTTFLSATRAVDVSISNDNKHLAIAEVDSTGTMVQSNIKIISIEKAQTDATNSVETNYQSEPGKLLINVEYQDREKLICMYTDAIHMLNGKDHSIISDHKDKKIRFQSIDLENAACLIEEKSSGLFTADSIVNLIDIRNGNTKQYIAESVTKEIYTYKNTIALNLGTEIEFVSTNGWLIKRYVANQEITNIVVSDNMAGIIYRDRIEIVNL